MQSTSVRIDSDTHIALKRIAADEHIRFGEAVRLAVRRYDQSTMGAQLAAEQRRRGAREVIAAGQTGVRMSRSVSRVLSMGSVTGTPLRGHPSTTAVADSLQRSTRELGRATLERSRSPDANAGPS